MYYCKSILSLCLNHAAQLPRNFHLKNNYVSPPNEGEEEEESSHVKLCDLIISVFFFVTN